jgi:hypothetical protein
MDALQPFMPALVESAFQPGMDADMSELRNDMMSGTAAKRPDLPIGNAPRPEDLGYPLDMEAHLSDEEASQILHTQHGAEIQIFIDALEMAQPVSRDTAASLMESLVKDTIPSDAIQVAVKMRRHQWERYLAPSENLDQIAHRAAVFLDSEAGVELANFYAKTISRTTD